MTRFFEEVKKNFFSVEPWRHHLKLRISKTVLRPMSADVSSELPNEFERGMWLFRLYFF